MIEATTQRHKFEPSLLFYAGLAMVMLALWFFFIPEWLTFMHAWRVELFASIFLLFTLSYLFYRAKEVEFRVGLSADERKFILYPIIAFILWSAVSIGWAASWKSAVHHTLVWTEYLIFFCIVRYLLERKGHFRKLVSVFALTLLLYALPSVAGYCASLIFGGTGSLGIRFARFGEQVLTLSPVLIAGVLTLRGRRFAIGTTAVAALWLLIFCSLGRSNIILYACTAIAIAVSVFSVRSFHKYRKKMALIAAVLILTPASLHLLSFLSVNPEIPMVQRFKNKEGISGSNNFRKLMISISGEMIADRPLAGVGADNFGFQANKYRAAYAEKHPDGPGLDQAENTIPERAHNEYMQIVAELGAVGGGIFIWFLAGIALIAYRALRNLGKQPLYAPVAVIGLGAFLISSLVSSYSFRVLQNGFVFFFVLAVASKLLLKREECEQNARATTLSPVKLRIACAAGVAACLLLTVYWTSRVSSVIVTGKANQTRDFEQAAELYDLAMRLDDENPQARNNFGMRLFWEQRYTDAAPYLREAIDIGAAPSSAFSYLAAAQILAGDTKQAEWTMKDAAALYPQSVFVLTRCAVLLRENGRPNESDAAFRRAASIDRTAANTWRAVLMNGPNVASTLAVNRQDYDQVMELAPQDALYAAVTERLIRFPEEQRFSMLKIPSFKNKEKAAE